MSVGRGPVFAGPLNYFVSCLSWARKTIVEKSRLPAAFFYL
jgi:hypothetical protein